MLSVAVAHGLGGVVSTVTPELPFAQSEVASPSTSCLSQAASAPRPVGQRRRLARPQEFSDLYRPTGEVLGQGANATVATYIRLKDGQEYAVKMIYADTSRLRQKVFKEIEIYNLCAGHENILELQEYFEEDKHFYLVFAKMSNSLLDTIYSRGRFTENDARTVMRQLASAVQHLHTKGIAHRDLKPENILCVTRGVDEVKLCDFDLGSGVHYTNTLQPGCNTPSLLTPVGSAEFMAPEVVDAWVTENATSYDKKCDVWSLGVIMYILLCGYVPFYAECEDPDTCQQQHCKACQERLFETIQQCNLVFPEEEWSTVSVEGRDLLAHLLVRDPHQRLSAREFLEHEWMHRTSAETDTPLHTPQALMRANSTLAELGTLVGKTNMINRRQLFLHSTSEQLQKHFPTERVSFTLGGDDDEEDEEDIDATPRVHFPMPSCSPPTKPTGLPNSPRRCISQILGAYM